MTSSESMTWEEAVASLRQQPGQRQLVVDCYYDDPLLGAAQRYHASAEWRAVQALVGPARGAALDIGAGRGIAAYALARDGWDTAALEPDPSPVVGAGAIRALASEAGLSIAVAQEWGEQLPYPAQKFELVHCRQVLHHARDLGQLCREMARVLKPGGVFLSTREHVISRPEDLKAFLDEHPLHRQYGGEYAYTLADYEAAIRGAGLTLERVLNPYESDINAHPDTQAGIKRRWALKLRLPTPAWIPDQALRWAGGRLKTPGRVYSFVARKPHAQA